MKRKQTKKPVVTLIGRTNVGKSTIFNKFTDSKNAITSNIPGTTRDRKFGECLWLGRSFTLIDTAGLDVSTEEQIDKEAIIHAKNAAEDSDLNILVVDAKAGMLPQDRAYAKMLKRLDKPLILAINKVDSLRHEALMYEFEALGIPISFGISAVTGSGTGDLLDEVLKIFKKELDAALEVPELPEVQIALVGKPNVGKSSLINKILGEERVIVSNIPHTTRDSQNISFTINKDEQDYKITIVDTAGIRKQRKIDSQIEKKSVEQSLRSIKRADVVLLVLDAGADITIQDKTISKEILDRSKSLIIVANKWDLVEDKDEHSDQRYIDYVHGAFPYLTWAPIVFISAKTGFKVNRLLDEVFDINQRQHKKISNTELASFLKRVIRKQSPKKSRGMKPPYIHKMEHSRTAPQTFTIYADQPENIHFSYMRFLKNQLREQYNLWGVGIKLITRLFSQKEKRLLEVEKRKANKK